MNKTTNKTWTPHGVCASVSTRSILRPEVGPNGGVPLPKRQATPRHAPLALRPPGGSGAKVRLQGPQLGRTGPGTGSILRYTEQRYPPSFGGCAPPVWLVVTGTWLDNCSIFFHILGRIIPMDELIFFRGLETTNQQLCLLIYNPMKTVDISTTYQYLP